MKMNEYLKRQKSLSDCLTEHSPEIEQKLNKVIETKMNEHVNIRANRAVIPLEFQYEGVDLILKAPRPKNGIIEPVLFAYLSGITGLPDNPPIPTFNLPVLDCNGRITGLIQEDISYERHCESGNESPHSEMDTLLRMLLGKHPIIDMIGGSIQGVYFSSRKTNYEPVICDLDMWLFSEQFMQTDQFTKLRDTVRGVGFHVVSLDVSKLEYPPYLKGLFREEIL